MVSLQGESHLKAEVWLEEEGQEAEVALSRLLLVVPSAAGWVSNGCFPFGVSSKPSQRG